jgi:hypothetical protein
MPAGRVRFVSRNKGMIVVSHDGGYTVVELLGDEGKFVVGDEVSGNWGANGGEPIYSHEPRTAHDAYFQGTWPTFEGAAEVARRTGGG